tara:strand:+ start:419 stop:1825 length:1407 start_codon:yes stop_codon:yes gene_type:complete
MNTEEGDSGPRVAVLNIVGLCQRHLGKNMPKLAAYARADGRKEQLIRPVLPALTCSAQATYLTGKAPSDHGIVGNGWYDRDLQEHHFWKQSNHLVKGEKIWESVKRKRKNFRCANLFWWYNMHSSVDFSITPRPLYASDGNKIFDIHSQPMGIREEIKRELGEFPFPSFWGPRAGFESSRWIADSAQWIEQKHAPELSLVYLPHLDYDLQRYGPNDSRIEPALQQIDTLAGELIDFYSKQGVQVVILSEYGITETNNVVYPNRVFRHQGWLSLKQEFNGETLDCGGSRVFALTDHQICHVYLQDRSESFRNKVLHILESMDGVGQILEGETRIQAGLNHERAGDFVLLAKEDAWFAYYYWEDDNQAPEFARCIDIHRKYGYDPAELFIDPNISFPSLRVASKLVAKKLGFRIHMDIIPLDPTLVQGSHGIIPQDPIDWPLIFGPGIQSKEDSFESTEVHTLLKNLLSG